MQQHKKLINAFNISKWTMINDLEFNVLITNQQRANKFVDADDVAEDRGDAIMMKCSVHVTELLAPAL